MTSLYLINPRPRTSYSDMALGYVSIPDLAIVTIAAMAPAHWDVSVCEEEVQQVDFDTSARFVGITGKNTQLPRMIELAAAFRQRGKTVLIGGPLASLDPEALRLHADILVTGEMEEIASRLFEDLEGGTWDASYAGGRPDLRSSPVPRWKAYPVERALMGALQTTRGCPFDCEFCDVIRYNGRKQRHKDQGQILRELDALHDAGFRQVFLTDDNFTVHRQFVRQTLDSLIAWNARHVSDPMRFVTQASVDIARDDDILGRCVDAGLDHLFVGIETVNADSLRETGKRQNLLMPPLEAVTRITEHGILVRNGIIVGFDHDGPDIFDILFEFLQSAPLPVPTVTTLVASVGTPLRKRLMREGRLIADDLRFDENIGTNIVPKLMRRDELLVGARLLMERLFTPQAFERRVMNFIAAFGEALDGRSLPPRGRSAVGRRGSYAMSAMRRLSARGESEAKMVSRVLAEGAKKEDCLRGVITCLVFYEQYRSYLDNLSGKQVLAA